MEAEIKSAKVDRDISMNFVKDAEATREKVYAYNQAIKKVMESVGHYN